MVIFFSQTESTPNIFFSKKALDMAISISRQYYIRSFWLYCSIRDNWYVLQDSGTIDIYDPFRYMFRALVSHL
jgi:hypothetical protein